jgi:hypothetical protein
MRGRPQDHPEQAEVVSKRAWVGVPLVHLAVERVGNAQAVLQLLVPRCEGPGDEQSRLVVEVAGESLELTR